MKKQLLPKFADWLEEQIQPEQFDFERVTNSRHNAGCHTIGCAIGWLPVFHKTIKSEKKMRYSSYGSFVFDDMLVSYDRLANIYFNMQDGYCLFTPNKQMQIKNWGDAHVCGKEATVDQVAAAIRHYVKIKGT